MTTVDVVVVGAGILGSYTALILRELGYLVVLCDRYSLSHSLGSSHGESRVIRSVYPIKRYTMLMKEAFAGWKRLE